MGWGIFGAVSLLGASLGVQAADAATASVLTPTLHVPLVLVLPFGLMLLSIAVLPLALGHWWESNTHKALIAGLLSVPVVSFLASQGEVGWGSLEHALLEYMEFMILLGALYIIAGGIRLQGDLQATPLVNCGFLGLGALLASCMGTTGASMLLIRPVLQTNAERRHVVHTVVFFIFMVSNVGGCLTPLGDPPLFLGYLRGVPFTWTLSLWPAWLAMNGALLLIYGLWDTVMYRREEASALWQDRTHIVPLQLQGGGHLLFLSLVILAVAIMPPPWRALLMLAATAGALLVGDRAVRTANQFTYGPLLEVAVLFIGIFVTMIPALALLRLHGQHLGVNTPARFFWAAGALSSFLDNAPTYATFFEAARAQAPTTPTAVLVAGIPPTWLEAISLGAVFMGANTYIGNGPNFMVKAIAESAGVPMPSFFGYMWYSSTILLPLFVLLTLLIF